MMFDFVQLHIVAEKIEHKKASPEERTYFADNLKNAIDEVQEKRNLFAESKLIVKVLPIIELPNQNVEFGCIFIRGRIRNTLLKMIKNIFLIDADKYFASSFINKLNQRG